MTAVARELLGFIWAIGIKAEAATYPEWRWVCPAFFASFFRGGQSLAPVQDRAQRALR